MILTRISAIYILVILSPLGILLKGMIHRFRGTGGDGKISETGLGFIFPPSLWEILGRLRGTGNVCMSRACRQTARRLLDYMDKNVDPCKDFYEFACGNFLKTTILPEDTESSNAYGDVASILRTQFKTILSSKTWRKEAKPYKYAKKLYSLCMDEASIKAQGMAPLKDLIKKVGGWPVLGNNWNEDNWSILETEVKQESLLHMFFILVDVFLDGSSDDHAKPIVGIKDQLELGLDREFLVEGPYNNVVQAYYKYMVDIAVLLGAEKQVAEDKFKLAILFNIELAKITLDKEDQRDPTKKGIHYSLSDMKKEWGWMDWGKLIQGMLPPDMAALLDEGIQVHNPLFFTKLEDLIKQTPKETVANYMVWRVVARVLEYVIPEAEDRKMGLVKAVTGRSVKEPRWGKCMNVVAGKMTVAMSSLYVKYYFSNHTRQQAELIVKHVRRQMLTVIESASWMNEDSKSVGKIKAAAVHEMIGHPEEALDDNKVELYYKDLPMINTAVLLEAALGNYKWQKHNYWQRKGTEWHNKGASYAVNAFYNKDVNMIIIPAVVLQLPFFSPDVPWYVNYGAIGTVIGHEITHGFDDVGHLYDPYGTLRNWWDDESKANFNKKKQCFIDQYSSFIDTKNTQLKVNGDFTLGENIADNGGLKLAYQAYKKHIHHEEQRLPGLEEYSSDQMFAIVNANLWCKKMKVDALRTQMMTDPHAPSEFRLKGTIMNWEKFGDLFQCKVGDEMNPKDKCSLW